MTDKPIAEKATDHLFTPLGDRSHHFATEQVMEAVGGEPTDYVRCNIENKLNLMTAGERYTLYGAIKKLVLATPEPPRAGEQGWDAFTWASRGPQLVHDLRKRVEELEGDKDFAGTIMGKICVYGTLVSGERPVDPPPHAAVDAILAQIRRAEKAERALILCEQEKAKLEEQTFVTAFVKGAQWWEFEKTGATMWGSDRIRAEQEAEKRFATLQPERPSGEKKYK